MDCGRTAALTEIQRASSRDAPCRLMLRYHVIARTARDDRLPRMTLRRAAWCGLTHPSSVHPQAAAAERRVPGNANPPLSATCHGGRHPLRGLEPPAGTQTWC